MRHQAIQTHPHERGGTLWGSDPGALLRGRHIDFTTLMAGSK